MDFFQRQDIARRNTRLLIVLFLLAVLLLIVLTNLALAGYLWFNQDYDVYSGRGKDFQNYLSFLSWERFGLSGLAIAATVAIVSGIKWVQLAAGGKVVAESMGGNQIIPQTDDRYERRCLNIVEEIALAANMPVPAVFVLEDERGINAFAAGISSADAVVTVTRGAITHLKRHELQGVIAHEFSHILNGDMRLSTHLAALLKGITFIGDVGLLMMHSNSRRSGANNSSGSMMMPVLGLALWIIGLIGEFTAGFIKAAISRQKEYLADASAVQFTRDPGGIGDALKVIGGYIPGTLVHSARAAEMSHIFFGQVEHRIWSFFSTHPPLEERIRRIDPKWNGEFIKRPVDHYGAEPRTNKSAETGVGRAALVTAAILGHEKPIEFSTDDLFTPAEEAGTEELQQFHAEAAERHEIPLQLVEQSHTELGAQALVLSLLIDEGPTVRNAQEQVVRSSETRGLHELTMALYPITTSLVASQRLPLLEMCVPALKSMSSDQYRQFKETLLQLVHADGATDLFEWCLFQLVNHYVDPQFYRVKPSRYRYNNLSKVRSQLRTVLSVLARQCSHSAETAFGRGAEVLGMPELAPADADHTNLAAFSNAVKELSNCYPLLKPRILQAMTTTAANDGELSGPEREIIYAVAAVMDCPLADEDTWVRSP